MVKDKILINELIEKLEAKEVSKYIAVPEIKERLVADEWLTPEQCQEVRNKIGKVELKKPEFGDSILDIPEL